MKTCWSFGKCRLSSSLQAGSHQDFGVAEPDYKQYSNLSALRTVICHRKLFGSYLWIYTENILTHLAAVIKTFYVARSTNLKVFGRDQLLMLMLWIRFLLCPSFHLSLSILDGSSSPLCPLPHKGCCYWAALCASTLSSDQGRRNREEVQIGKQFMWRNALNKKSRK